jgi:hypothetical protein
MAGSRGDANGEESKNPWSLRTPSNELLMRLRILGKSSGVAFRYDTSDNVGMTELAIERNKGEGLSTHRRKPRHALGNRF